MTHPLRGTIALCALLVCTGCAGFQRAQETRWMSDARQIASARFMHIAEQPDHTPPTLSDIAEQHAYIDQDRIAPFEVTQAWHDPEADDVIVLRQRDAAHGYRVVALGNGAAMRVEE